MGKDATFSARIDRELKENGDRILAQLGIKPSQALTMFYSQIVMQEGIPFELKIPNDDLQQRFKDAREGKNMVSYPDVETAMKDMWGDD